MGSIVRMIRRNKMGTDLWKTDRLERLASAREAARKVAAKPIVFDAELNKVGALQQRPENPGIMRRLFRRLGRKS